MTFIITGANRGLGYETALSLAANNTRTLVLTGQDLPSLGEAAQKIMAVTGNTNLVPMHLDLASLDSVRNFAAEFRSSTLPPLETIICNAGISKSTVKERSSDGYEVTFAVNHLGHFLLVNLQLESLQPPARIVFVSSGTHAMTQASGPMQPPRYVKAEWLAYPERDPNRPIKDTIAGGQAYSTSKLCNILCTYELVRRLEAGDLSTPEHPITVNAFDPGLMAGTELGRDSKGSARFLWYNIIPVMSRFMNVGRSTAQSGADLAYLATDPALSDVTAKYFSGREMVASSAESYDLIKATDLWQTSVELSRLRSEESPLIAASVGPSTT